MLVINCPQEKCEFSLNEDFIEMMLSKESYLKYTKFKGISLINHDPNLQWCIEPSCGKIVRRDGKNPQLKCICNQVTCFDCGSNWHPNRTCQEVNFNN